MHLGVILMLALRNLRRNLRRTILTATAFIIGGALLTFAQTFGDGTHEQWIDSGVRTGSGHVTVEVPAFRVSRKIEDRLPGSTLQLVRKAVESSGAADRVTDVFYRLTINGLATSASGARPAQVLGVDPTIEAALSPLDEQVVEGRYLKKDDRLAAYVGAGLVDALDLRIGSRLVVMAQDAHKEVAGQLVRVVGIFRTGIGELDNAVVHVPITTAGEWLGTGSDVTNVGVMVDSSLAVPGLVRHLRRELAGPIAKGDATVMGWREAMPALHAIIVFDEWGAYLVLGILFVIIGFSIINTVLMSVLHRHREFGVLQALGLTPRQTASVVLVEGLLQTVVCAIIGVGVGLAVTAAFSGGIDISELYNDQEMQFSGVAIDPVIVPMVTPVRILYILGFMLLVGVVSSVYPAMRAATIDVTESMKFER
jgi:ABC-type lipoprotein release transport system permease subunit